MILTVLFGFPHAPSNEPSTTAVLEKDGAGLWTRALGVYAGNAMMLGCNVTKARKTMFRWIAGQHKVGGGGGL